MDCTATVLVDTPDYNFSTEAEDVPAGQPTVSSNAADGSPHDDQRLLDGSSPDIAIQKLQDDMDTQFKAWEEEAAASVESRPVDPELEQWKTAASQGFAAHGSMGTKFQRACSMDADLKDKYKHCTTFNEKKEFRQRWASTKYEDCLRVKSQTQSWQDIDEEAGTYECGKIIWDREGGDVYGLAAARNYITACIHMGAPWVQFKEMTGRQEYLYLKKPRSIFLQSAGAFTRKLANPVRRTQSASWRRGALARALARARRRPPSWPPTPRRRPPAAWL